MNWNELDKVKICLGSRYTCPFYTVTTEGLQPNSNGEYIDATPITAEKLIRYINSGEYRKECNEEYEKHKILHPDDNRPLKHFASSVYAFKDHRYTIKEKIYDEQLNRSKEYYTGYAYKQWTGFIGYDFDVPKYYTKTQRALIGNKLKELIAVGLRDKHWLIGTLISTGGNGTHCLTAVKIPDWYHELTVDDMKAYHDCVYWYILKHMISFIYDLLDEFDFIEEAHLIEFFDDCMNTISQTLNISPIEDSMYINPDFIYKEISDITIDNYKTYFDNMFEDPMIIEDNANQLFIKLYGTPDDIAKNSKYKKKFDARYEIIKCDDFDITKLDNCKGPWHFEHKRNNNTFFTGNQIIHTLLHFFNVETVKAIWYHPKFYDDDPKDWIRFIDSWDFDESVPPNFKVMNWLNLNCFMNLHYKIDDSNTAYVINLKNNEYLWDKKDILLEKLKNGYNLWDSAPGTGKTTFFKNLFDINIFDPIGGDPLNIILTEPYNSICKSKFLHQAKNGVLDIVIKSKRIKFTSFNNIVSNYDHVVLMDDKSIEETDILIIDESHLMFSEYYRYGTLIKFIEYISQFKKVLFMTGTPSIESSFFYNCNVIKINKPNERVLTHEFIKFQPIEYENEKNELKIWNHFEPWNLSVFIHTLVNSGKKVYVYDSNISYQKCLKFKSLLGDLKIAIYHKKELDDAGQGDIEYIDENHRLGDKYDVLISSCYFGVGNDLYDGDEGKYNKAATILCGIHSPNEIYQVCSRWRNMSEVNIYTIIDNAFYNVDEYNYEEVYEHEKKKLYYERDDATNRSKSITIFNQEVKNASDSAVDFCACLKAIDFCSKSINYINNILFGFGIRIDERIMPLVYDLDNYIQHIEYSNILKETRSKEKANFIKGILDNYNNLTSDKLEWIKTDSKIAEWERIAYKLGHIYDKDTYESQLGNICRSSNVDCYKLLIKLYKNKDNLDYNECYHLYLCRSKMVKDDYMINDWLSYNYSIIMKTFVLYLSNINKGDSYKLINRYNINDYFNKWYKAVIDFSIFDIECNYNLIFKGDLNTYVIDCSEIELGQLELSDYNKNIERSKYANKSYEQELLNELVFYHCNKQIIRNERNREIGSIGKSVIITNKFKHIEKYNLTIGQEFNSCTELAKYAKKSNKTVSQWMIKGWIRKR